MAENRKTFNIKSDQFGEVKVADEVVAIIAGLATTEVEGVSSMAGNITNENGTTTHEILTLKDNEVIQFRAPSFKTILTYPAYVHYYLKLNPTDSYEAAIPVTMQTLGDFLKGGPEANSDQTKAALKYYINDTNMPTTLIK